jgi:hypothetical protein
MKLYKTMMLGVVAAVVSLAAVSYDAQGQGGNRNPGVIPPNARYRGLTYGEWGARWWQAAFALPIVDGDHPLFSGGAFGGEDGVVFLSAVVGAPAKVPITIPAGTPLFVPVINVECSVIEDPPFHGDDEEELRACANGHIDDTFGLFAVIDGRPVNNLDAYGVGSPLFEFGPLPANAIFGLPAGATSDAVDAGVYLLLAPLSVGQHTLRIGGTFGGELSGSIDTTFIITVVPRGRR